MNRRVLPCLFFCTFIPVGMSGQTISTIAGNGTAGFSGDSSMATLAEINNPFAVAADTMGNVFFTDRHNNRVRKISVSGIIVTIAGNGTAGYNGDGIAGTVAELNDPIGIAADNVGNVYVADRLNNRVRRIDAAGNISTLAGNGSGGFAGDNSLATAAQLNTPRGVAADEHGNVYIADQGNGRIRKVAATGIITTIAGTGTGGYNGDGIAATAAELYNPYSIAIDAAGNIYVADVDNERIRKINTAGVISTIAGTGISGFSGDGSAAVDAQLSEPIGVAVDVAGNIYIAGDYNGRIREVNATGAINTIAGTGTAGYNGDGIAATAAELNSPTGVAVGRNGPVYIADYNNNRVRKMPQATLVKNIAPSFFATVSPNPNFGLFAVTVTTGVEEQLRIVIYDATGRIVKEAATLSGRPLELLIDEQPGVYFIRATGSSGVWSGKVEVE